jgi:serine/threonine-protein kinase
MRYCPRCGTVTENETCPKDGTPTMRKVQGARGRLAAGDVIGGRYKIVGELGRGGFGAVFDSVHTTTGHPVAVKILTPAGAEDGQELVRRFFQEASTTSRLSHPNTVRVFDFGQTEEGDLFLAMERLSGESLQTLLMRLAREGLHMMEAQAVEVGASVLRSLGEAHANGLVHRDMKPANIFMHQVSGGEQIVKVLDFGIVKDTDTRMTQAGKALGTPTHMSPEQAMDKPVDARADLYALGVVLYECLTGTLPFLGENPLAIVMQHVTEPVPPLLQRVPAGTVRPALAAVVERALAKRPEDRFQNAVEMRNALQAAMGQMPQTGVYRVPSSLQAGGLQAAAVPVVAPPALHMDEVPAPTPQFNPIAALNPLAPVAHAASTGTPRRPLVPLHTPGQGAQPRSVSGGAVPVPASPLPRSRPVSSGIDPAMSVRNAASGTHSAPRPAPIVPRPAPVAVRAESTPWPVVAPRHADSAHIPRMVVRADDESTKVAPADSAWAPKSRLAPPPQQQTDKAPPQPSKPTVPPSQRTDAVVPTRRDARADPDEPTAYERQAVPDDGAFVIGGGGIGDGPAVARRAPVAGATPARVSLQPAPSLQDRLAAAESAPVRRREERPTDPPRGQHPSTDLAAHDPEPVPWQPPDLQGHAGLSMADGIPGFFGQAAFAPTPLAVTGLDPLAERMMQSLANMGRPVRQAQRPSVSALWLAEDARKVVYADQGGGLHLVDLGQLGDQPVNVLDLGDAIEVGAHDALVAAIAGSPDGRFVASGSVDGVVRAWDPGLGSQVGELALDSGVTSLAVATDGKLLVVGCSDGSVLLVEVPGLVVRRTLRGHRDAVTAVALAGSRRLVVTAAEDGVVRTWDPVGGGARITVRGHDGAVGAVVVTPAGQLVVSGGWDGKLMAWDGRSGERRLDVAAHEDVVAGIALDKNAAAVATAADDRAARVWSLQDGRLMAERRDFRAGVKLVRFTDDHRNEVLCGSWDGTFRKLKY